MNLHNRWRAALAAVRRAPYPSPEFDDARRRIIDVYRAALNAKP